MGKETPAAAGGDAPVPVANRAAWQALPPGTRFVMPDGQDWGEVMADTYAPGQDPFAEQTDIPAGVDPFGAAPAAPPKPFIDSLVDEAAATGRGYARQAKLFTRSLASAAASPVNLVGDATNKFINGAGQLMGYNPQLPSVTDWHQQQMTQAGLPQPTTGIERFTQGMSESAPAFALPVGVVPQMAGNAVIGATQAKPGQEGTGAAVGTVAGALGPVLGQTMRLLGKGAANVLGTTTGAGAESVNQAYRNAPGFVENMRGNVEPGVVVDQAKQGLQTMRKQMYDAYAAAKGGWAADKTPLNFQPIGQAFDDAAAKFSFKGVPVPGVPEVAGKVKEALMGWLQRARQDPAFLTVEGLDALKRHLNGIVPTDVTNRTGRAFVTEVVDGVKSTIIDQRPEYEAAMKDYWSRSNQLDEIERSLSLGDKATTDTALRKLQSLMRNNVNSNFGQRMTSAEALAAQGGQDILPAVAGQSMNSWTPRGLQGVVASGTGVSGILNPGNLAALPLMSPRIVGETARATGRFVDAEKTKATLEALRRMLPSLTRGLIE